MPPTAAVDECGLLLRNLIKPTAEHWLDPAMAIGAYVFPPLVRAWVGGMQSPRIVAVCARVINRPAAPLRSRCCSFAGARAN